MNKPAVAAQGAPLLSRRDPNSPALFATEPSAIAIRAGTTFGEFRFDADILVGQPANGYEAGTDYAVQVIDGVPLAIKLDGLPLDPSIVGGYHFAPGGNALGRKGGDSIPQINPCSIWDVRFRPACPDPRGMALVDGAAGKFWVDIYLLNKDHLTRGTSAFGVTIADGDDAPRRPDGGYFERLDYETALAVMKHHGKGLLSFDEFAAAAIGVTEKSAHSKKPKIAGLDAARTSRAGVMQASGNMWVWGHDGDPDDPRPSLFGGSWLSGSSAGSRYAILDDWPAYSSVFLGARGRSDHLQLA